jgi:alkylation response protein AidB-like acyl-CoA dehydrogenase
MDFGLSVEQSALRDSAAQFAREALNENMPARDKGQVFSPENWRRCAEFGIQGLPVPVRFGGKDADPVAIMTALEGLGYGCRDNGLCFALNAHLWGCVLPILKFGDEGQKGRLLPGLSAGGSIGALAMSEPEAGSDAYAIRTTAELRDGRYWLNGHKVFVTNGPVAHVFLVLATLDPSAGAKAITAFLVEKGTAGLVAGPPVDKMGLRTATMGEVKLENCAIPAENRLGREGAGLAVFGVAMEWERGFILSSAVGTMQRQFEECRQHARSRRQFGQPIGAFQHVSGKLVDMQLRLEASRMLLYKVGWLKSQDRTAILESAMAKLFISESWVQSSQDAIQIHGGRGYLTENEIERDLRDALASRIYSGTSELQRRMIAQWMGLA